MWIPGEHSREPREVPQLMRSYFEVIADLKEIIRTDLAQAYRSLGNGMDDKRDARALSTIKKQIAVHEKRLELIDKHF